MTLLFRLRWLAALLVLSPLGAASLAEQFGSPPDQTRPWCFWYWINNHISRTGITHDLEAMKKIGVGTALIGNDYLAGLDATGVPILSKEWWDLTAFAVHEGRRLGVDIGVFNAPGWSQTGGPWISNGQSMRFLNWSESRVSGGELFSGTLPVPRRPFQDVAVLAVPVPKEDQDVISRYAPEIEAEGVKPPAVWLADGDRSTIVPFPAGQKHWAITLTVKKPFAARSLTLCFAPAEFSAHAQLQVQTNDGSYRTVREFPVDRSNSRVEVGFVPNSPVTIAFPVESATRWRLVLTDIVTLDPAAGLAEIELSTGPRVERVMEKQLAKLYSTPKPMWDVYLWPAQSDSNSEALASDPSAVVDLTHQMQPDGRLRWQAPPGDWIILRMGMNTTGVTNHPAQPNATGLEVDRMNRAALDHHYDSFITPLVRLLAPDDRKALKYLAIDSYETGSQNWTDDFAATFRKRYGYDPKPWLATLTGRVVGNADRSNRFLWDLRRLVADQMAYVYAAQLRERSRADGMQLWLENYGHWGFPAEFLQYGGQTDLVAGEFWMGKPLGDIECRAASSAAHTYGQPITYAEAFTSSGFYDFYPYAMKARGDWAFGEGINHFVLQGFMEQPEDDKFPGVNAYFGTEFSRTQTWFGPGKAWIDYLRRCHLLLQQGRNIAKLAYYIGEDAPKMTGIRRPALPNGYTFDYINAEVILTRLKVKEGHYELPDGTRYDLLVLPPLDNMRPEVLRKIGELVAAGGPLFGAAPSRSPSLENYPASDAEVCRLAARIWTKANRKVFTGDDLEGALRQLGSLPDVRGLDPAKSVWVHRSAPEREIYFVSNQTDRPTEFSPVFHVAGRSPEVWDAVSGTVLPSARFAEAQGGTRVDFALGPRGSVFVVFPAAAAASPDAITAVVRDGHPDGSMVERVVPNALNPRGQLAHLSTNGSYHFQFENNAAADLTVSTISAAKEPAGPWHVQFPPHRDVPEHVDLPRLASWTENTSAAIRYFSGSATYTNSFALSAEELTPSRHYYLDLGRVEIIAEVSINGTPVGITWLPPYRLDVTRALHAGANQVAITVTNGWKNRIIGDIKYPGGFPEGPHPKEFQTHLLDTSKLKPNGGLQPSGLIGPVRLVPEEWLSVPLLLRP